MIEQNGAHEKRRKTNARAYTQETTKAKNTYRAMSNYKWKSSRVIITFLALSNNSWIFFSVVCDTIRRITRRVRFVCILRGSVARILRNIHTSHSFHLRLLRRLRFLRLHFCLFYFASFIWISLTSCFNLSFAIRRRRRRCRHRRHSRLKMFLYCEKKRNTHEKEKKIALNFSHR